MDRLKLHTPDLTAQNIEKLAALFPNCVTETTDAKGKLKRGIDFDQLRQELSDHVVEGPRERYHLDWPGKREALLAANAPIAKTLRPCREESVDFDTTKNLFIEGDNLDALKLLQETYLGKVKLIYIDPPYNTGNDFIYDDDFAEDSNTYFSKSNQTNDEGIRMIANTEANGRFHSDWLNMMYPRLKLARNLLREDGLLFVSIDDNEAENMKVVLNEVFGAENFLAQIMWQKMYSGKADASHFGRFHEYILCFSKNIETAVIRLLPRTEAMDARYTNPDSDQRGPWLSNDLTAAGERSAGHFEIKSPSGKLFDSPPGKHWLYSQETMTKLLQDNRISFGRSGDSYPRLKRFLTEVQQGRRVNTIWLHEEVGHTDEGTKEVRKLFPSGIDFQAPKPTRLLKQILAISIDPKANDIVLDFFAGSGTTADAVSQFNSETSGNTRYVTVQLQEPIEGSVFTNIAEFTKERLRRAGKKIREENPLFAGDIGFRVLKIDTSNMRDVYYTPDAVKQDQLELLTDNIKEDRIPEDLLFQVLVDWGVDLALPITQETIAKKKVFFVDGNALAACFDPNITEELVKELAKKKPLRAVFRDSSYGSDSVKINVEQIFKLLSPGTELKSL
jgi:adenine-specific DNA-methyltransferase